MGGLVFQRGNIHLLHDLLHPAVYLLRGQPQIHRAEGDVPVHVRRKQLVVRVLEHNPHPLAKPGNALPVVGDFLPGKVHLPRLRGADAVQVQKQRGLSGAVAA